MKKLLLSFAIALLPLLAMADTWTPVGMGTWYEGPLGNWSDFINRSWNVPIERSSENPKLFRTQPYWSGGYHPSGYGTSNVYVYIHTENPEKVYMEEYVYYYRYSYTYYYNVWVSQKCEENGWDTNYYGRINGDCIEFPETAFMIYSTNYSHSSAPAHGNYNQTSTVKHKIVFPEGVLDGVPETFVSIGEGKWLDATLYLSGEQIVLPEVWRVEFSKSADLPERYCANPWSSDDAKGYFGSNYDETFASRVVICAENPEKVYLEKFSVAGYEFAQEVPENGFASGSRYGSIENGVITIPAKSFKSKKSSATDWDAENSGYRDMVITLPEGYHITPSNSGVYFGITAFNYEPQIKAIELLNKDNKDNFKQFVNEREKADATYLYYSADVAIKALSERNYPADLNSVALITFTDGNDDGSLEKAPDVSWNYEDYQNYLAGRLRDARVQGLPINAFSIGLKGKDIGDYNYEMFKSNLRVLSSAPEQATEVSDMREVEATINGILDNLEKSWVNKKVSCSINMRATGDLIRFTLDKTREEMNNDPENSDLWIEGTFSRDDNSLNDVTYNGFTSTSGSKVTAVKNEVNGRTKYKFTFENLRDANGNTLETGNIEFWHKTQSNPVWQPHTEFKQGTDAGTETERTSSAVMFVMDCSDSLDKDFPELQRVVNTLIDRLAGDEKSGIEEIPFEFNSNEGDGPVEYFNLQGVKVNNPSSGMFIRRQGNKVSKVIIR